VEQKSEGRNSFHFEQVKRRQAAESDCLRLKQKKSGGKTPFLTVRHLSLSHPRQAD
jgi:hypothetical protein